MIKKYEAPQFDIQYFSVTDRLTAEGEPNYSATLPDDPEFGWENW